MAIGHNKSYAASGCKISLADPFGPAKYLKQSDYPNRKGLMTLNYL